MFSRTASRMFVAVLGVLVITTGGFARESAADLSSKAGLKGASPNSPEHFTFAVLSDRGGGHIPGKFESAISEINLLKPDFVMCVGDLVEGYVDDQKALDAQWQEMEAILSKLDAPFFFTPGNHDVQADKDKRNISLPTYAARHGVKGQTYYSFDYRKCHFVVLDTATATDDKAFAAKQFAWLEKDLRKADKSEHLFVFYHHPLWNDKELWPQLAKLLPKDKTTIINGHWHSLNYSNVDGIPAYGLASTSSNSDTTGPANTRMFGYVSVDRGKPTIAFIPIEQIKPAGFAAEAMAMTDTIRSAGTTEVAADGGEVTLAPKNATDKPVKIAYAWKSPDWTVEPATAAVTVAPKASAKAVFKLTPKSKTAANPVLTTDFAFADSQSVHADQAVPVSRAAQLGKLPADAKVDGKLDKWSTVRPTEINDSHLAFENGAAWKGAGDSSAKLWSGLAGEKLVFAIDVTDDQIVTDRENPWEEDGVEICWDVRPSDKKESALTEGSGQLAVVVGDKDGPPKKFVWIPASQYGLETPASIQCFTRRAEKGYVIEMAIPFRELGLNGGTAASAGEIGLAVCLDDLDTSGGDQLKRFSTTGTGEFYRDTTGYARLKTK